MREARDLHGTQPVLAIAKQTVLADEVDAADHGLIPVAIHHVGAKPAARVSRSLRLLLLRSSQLLATSGVTHT